MPTQYTPSLGLNLPEIGASRDTWGALLNQNFSALDNFVYISQPIGALLDFAGPQPPAGWLICDGRAVSRTTYAALFAVIGTYWGAGDGSTTFALPNLNGRSGIGPGQVTDANGSRMSFTFATTLGWLSNPITQSNLPNYAMLTDVHGGHNHSGGTTGAGGHAHSTDGQGSHAHGGAYLPDHAHSAWTDAQGDHQHYLPGTWESPNGNRQRNTSFSGGFGELDNPWTSTAGNHAHNVGVAGAGNLGLAIPADGYHGHNISYVGDHAHGIYWDGDHQHYVYLNGGGQWLGLMSPVAVVTKIIFAGKQAVVSMMATLAASDDPATAPHTPQDEINELREQVARLMAIIGSPRLIQSPMRGPH